MSLFSLSCSFFSHFRKKADLSMEGQFLIRQIYDDEITYNLIGAAVEILSKSCWTITLLHVNLDCRWFFNVDLFDGFFFWHESTLYMFGAVSLSLPFRLFPFHSVVRCEWRLNLVASWIYGIAMYISWGNISQDECGISNRLSMYMKLWIFDWKI